jgi:hypothetical protein
MVVPPLVLVTILETDSLSPEVLIPDLSAKFQEFDRSSQSVKACTILRPVLDFLWAVAHKKVPASIIGVDQSKGAQEWSNKVHLSSVVLLHLQLGPPPFWSPSPTAKSATRSVFYNSGRTLFVEGHDR